MSTSSSEPSADSAPSPAEAPSSSPAEASLPSSVEAPAPQQAPDAPQDGAPDAPQDEAPVARVLDAADPGTVRRAPRYGRFAFAGLVVGAVLALVLALLGVSEYSLRDVFLILVIALGTVGVLAGLSWALISDRRSLRRHGRS